MVLQQLYFSELFHPLTLTVISLIATTQIVLPPIPGCFGFFPFMLLRELYSLSLFPLYRQLVSQLPLVVWGFHASVRKQAWRNLGKYECKTTKKWQAPRRPGAGSETVWNLVPSHRSINLWLILSLLCWQAHYALNSGHFFIFFLRYVLRDSSSTYQRYSEENM